VVASKRRPAGGGFRQKKASEKGGWKESIDIHGDTGPQWCNMRMWRSGVGNSKKEASPQGMPEEEGFRNSSMGSEKN